MTIKEENELLVERIKQLCKASGITVKEVETKLGYPNATIGKWASAAKRPPHDRVTAVADFLGCTINFLRGDDEKPTTPEGDGLDRAILAFLHRLPAERLRGILIALEAPEELLAMLDREEPKE